MSLFISLDLKPASWVLKWIKSSSVVCMFPPQPLDVSWLLEITYTIITSFFKLHYVMICNQLHISSPASHCMKFKPFLARSCHIHLSSCTCQTVLPTLVLVTSRQSLFPSWLSWSTLRVPLFLSRFLMFLGSFYSPHVQLGQLVSVKLHSDHVL